MELNGSVSTIFFKQFNIPPLFAVYLIDLHWVMVLIQHSSPVAALREAWSQLQKSAVTKAFNFNMTAARKVNSYLS